jgi:hypothetical protein
MICHVSAIIKEWKLIKVKVYFTLKWAVKTHRGSRDIG